jgi:RNA polymerase sigma-70 factor (ECF subfamily)
MDGREVDVELERLHGAGFAWALACCNRDREDALDVLQASYLKVLDGRAKFGGHSSFKTFLFGVIRHTASEQRRRNVVRNLFLGEWARRRQSPPTESGPEERLALIAALGMLARRQREVLELVFYMGLSVEEAADAKGISVGSASVHYDRGKKRLVSLLQARRHS